MQFYEGLFSPGNGGKYYTLYTPRQLKRDVDTERMFYTFYQGEKNEEKKSFSHVRRQ